MITEIKKSKVFLTFNFWECRPGYIAAHVEINGYRIDNMVLRGPLEEVRREIYTRWGVYENDLD